MKAHSIGTKGQGWHKQSLRHREAKIKGYSPTYYHSTNTKLPKQFVVKNKSDEETKINMEVDYGINNFKGGLFVNENKELTQSYGDKTYEITSKKQPIRVSFWGTHYYPLGSKVKAIPTTRNKKLDIQYKKMMKKQKDKTP